MSDGLSRLYEGISQTAFQLIQGLKKGPPPTQCFLSQFWCPNSKKCGFEIISAIVGHFDTPKSPIQSDQREKVKKTKSENWAFRSDLHPQGNFVDIFGHFSGPFVAISPANPRI